MQYPLISEYIDSILCAEENFDSLNYLRPVLDQSGNPVMSSGNFAVVFKMRSEKDGRYYALKCFLKDQAGRGDAYRMISDELEYVSSPYLAHVAYYESELFVDANGSDDTEFPVLLMDWVDGMPLDAYVREHRDDKFALHELAYRFSKLSMWLLTQPFAHGDLKPDNILVTPSGSLVLVDYDGMYVPKMQGSLSRELGSPDYRHPNRTSEEFNEHIDDFSLSVLALSLKAISLDPSLLDRSISGDGLLLSVSDFRNPSESELLQSLSSFFYDSEFERLYSLFLIAHSCGSLSDVSSKLMEIEIPTKVETKEKLSLTKTKSFKLFLKEHNIRKFNQIFIKNIEDEDFNTIIFTIIPDEGEKIRGLVSKNLADCPAINTQEGIEDVQISWLTITDIDGNQKSSWLVHKPIKKFSIL